VNRVALVLDSRINSVLDLIAPCLGIGIGFGLNYLKSTCGYNSQNMLYSIVYTVQYDGLNIWWLYATLFDLFAWMIWTGIGWNLD
jgi:hypothetical protein